MNEIVSLFYFAKIDWVKRVTEPDGCYTFVEKCILYKGSLESIEKVKEIEKDSGFIKWLGNDPKEFLDIERNTK